ncbi:regulatory LuxR family protein [Saccharothrix variisporea]|uniref:Regulatory LuxR family protein n=1 Tax=Saccharothrix variisporea TaxID=543527 RepID=A0A495XP84_9PSEU|nr:regulatory LuxR family protein [Saccharothrix variisporea]
MVDRAEVDRLERELLRNAYTESRLLSVDDRPRHDHEDGALIGVRRRTLYTAKSLDDNVVRQSMGEVRVLRGRPARGVLVVDDVAVLRAGAAGAVVVRAPEVVALVAAYFDALWTDAVPLGDGDHAPVDGLSAVQQRIVRLAAGGFKDDTIARMLGLSTRSVRRHLEKLAARVGATNRLSLGVAATRLGWV